MTSFVCPIRIRQNIRECPSGLNSCVAEAELDALEDMVLVAFYLGSKFLHHRYSAVARPPEPALQFGVCFLNGGHLQNQAEPFLDAVRPVKQRGIISRRSC